VARRRKLPLHPLGDGTFRVGLDDAERELLADLPRQLREVIEAGDEASVRRLFPPAYHRAEDVEREEEFRRYMREELLTSKLGAMSILQESAYAETLTAEQLQAWMGAINDVRLVLGTQLDVYEGMEVEDLPEDDPRLPALHVYSWLSGLLELVVHRLMGDD
jgi:hypothetical protein